MSIWSVRLRRTCAGRSRPHATPPPRETAARPPPLDARGLACSGRETRGGIKVPQPFADRVRQPESESEPAPAPLPLLDKHPRIPTGLPYIPSCPTLRVSEWHFTGADVSSMLGPFTGLRRRVLVLRVLRLVKQLEGCTQATGSKSQSPSSGADVSSMLGPFTDWNEGAFAGGSLAVVL
jgi:hypothetical protein